MDVLRRLNRLINSHTVGPGHLYRSKLTDEEMVITSVGRSMIEVERRSAGLRDTANPRKDVFKRALDAGVIVHDKERCENCNV